MAFVDPNGVIPVAPTPVSGQAPISSGGAGVGGSTKPAAGTPGVNVPAQPSAQLSAYLNANQPQSTAFGSNVASTLAGQTAAAGNAINPAVNAYTGQLYTVPTDTTVNQQVATAPSGLTSDQTQTFQTELGASQNAPNSANTFESTSPYQDLTTGIQNAVEQANLWNSGNSVPNLTTALAPFESSNATAGGTTLDALLLSQTPGAYSQIQNAVAPAANLQGQLQTATGQADTALQGAIQQDNAATAAAQAAPQTYASNLTSYLTNAVNQATQGDTAQNQQILSDLTANTPTQAELQILGVTPDQWTMLSNEMAGASQAGLPIDLATYLSQTQPNVTDQNIATPTQYADVAALQSILGGNTPSMPITATTANEAGTAPTNLNSFNLLGANQAADVAPLQAKENQDANTLAYLQDQYAHDNHYGGQTAGQMAAIEAPYQSDISAINNEIAAINAAKTPQTAADVVPLADLQAQAGGIQNQINAANQAYNVDHNGGQSPEQQAAIIAGLTNQLNGVNQQIARLQGTGGFLNPI